MYRSLLLSNFFVIDVKFMDYQLRVMIVLVVFGIRLNNYIFYCFVLVLYFGVYGQWQFKLFRFYDYVKSLFCECFVLELFKNLEVKIFIFIVVIFFDKCVI